MVMMSGAQGKAGISGVKPERERDQEKCGERTEICGQVGVNYIMIKAG